jgi:hypothetical protein
VITRAVGSSPAELLGRKLMLDVLDQQHGQRDRWVLLAVILRRLHMVNSTAIKDAIAAVQGKGWIETDIAFGIAQRLRLTDTGWALLSRGRRMHHIERPHRAGRRFTRRALPSRQGMRAFHR